MNRIFLIVLTLVTFATSFDSYASAFMTQKNEISQAGVYEDTISALVILAASDDCPLHQLSNCSDAGHCHSGHAHLFTLPGMFSQTVENVSSAIPFNQILEAGFPTGLARPPIA